MTTMTAAVETAGAQAVRNDGIGDNPLEAYTVECARAVARLLFVAHSESEVTHEERRRRCGVTFSLCSGMAPVLEMLERYATQNKASSEVQRQLWDAMAVVGALRELAAAGVATQEQGEVAAAFTERLTDPMQGLAWTLHERIVGGLPWCG